MFGEVEEVREEVMEQVVEEVREEVREEEKLRVVWDKLSRLVS